MAAQARRRLTGTPGELHALVLAGGFGRRLEPLTRRLFGEAIPKQFCRFEGGRSLLQQTLERLAPLVPAARMTVVVDQSQLHRATAQLHGWCDARIEVQPCDRGTAVGVLLPLRSIAARAPDALVLIAASDHGVRDEACFRAVLRRAEEAVRRHSGRIVLLGAQAEAPTTDYGWIVHGAPVGDAAPGELDQVVRFVEKPLADLAHLLHRSGTASWNTMVLVGSAATLLAAFARELPELTAAMDALPRRAGGEGRFAAAYAALPVANFSADVLGRANELAVVTLPTEVGWTDLGTEPRMLEWMAQSAPRAAAPAGLLVTQEA